MNLNNDPIQKIERRIQSVKLMAVNGDHIAATHLEHELLSEVIKAFDCGILNIHDGLQSAEIISALADCINLKLPRSFE
jgi:hypothetical protein